MTETTDLPMDDLSIYLNPWATLSNGFENYDGGASVGTNRFVITDALLSSVFTRTLDDTRSPARAIQAFRTTQYRMVYYASVIGFTGQLAHADIDEEVQVLAPTGQKIGFFVVMSILGLHLATFFVVLWLFYRHSQSSILEQAWSTIGQVATHPDVQHALITSTGKTDEQVSQWIAFHKGLDPIVNTGFRFWQRATPAAALTSLVGGTRQIINGRAAVHSSDSVVRYHIRDGVVTAKVVKSA
ncbi:hypothetical protein MN608_10885 [Microdochium nivale]|nr:hypothetical protein MN608_10885 [Microdochium nivale]